MKKGEPAAPPDQFSMAGETTIVFQRSLSTLLFQRYCRALMHTE